MKCGWAVINYSLHLAKVSYILLLPPSLYLGVGRAGWCFLFSGAFFLSSPQIEKSAETAARQSSVYLTPDGDFKHGSCFSLPTSERSVFLLNLPHDGTSSLFSCSPHHSLPRRLLNCLRRVPSLSLHFTRWH